jgi:DNA-binding GntR family transcriptional regulator
MAYALTTREDQAPASAVREAYEFLRRRIRDGQLQSGVRIKAEEVAAELGISRMPVREALRQLDTEGLVTIRPNRGAVVTRLGPDEILELFEMRAALEGIAIRRAVSRFDEDNFEEIGLILSRLDRARPDIDHGSCATASSTTSSASRAMLSGFAARCSVCVRRGTISPHRHAAERTGGRFHRGTSAADRGHPRRRRRAAERTMRTHILETAHELIAALIPPAEAGSRPGAKRSPVRA